MFALLSKIDSAKTFQYYFSIMFMIMGTDKFFNFLTNWNLYLWEALPKLLHIDMNLTLYGIGVLEFSCGVILWLNYRIGGLIGTVLLFGIAANLILAGKFFNIALLDIGLAICAFALSQSTPAKNDEDEPTVFDNL